MAEFCKQTLHRGQETWADRGKDHLFQSLGLNKTEKFNMTFPWK